MAGRLRGIRRPGAAGRVLRLAAAVAGLASLPAAGVGPGPLPAAVAGPAAPPAAAAGGAPAAPARLDAAASGVADAGPDIVLRLALSEAVPWRAGLLADPPRLVLDFHDLAFAGIDRPGFVASPRVRAMRSGTLAPGWSRLVLELDGPVAIATAGMARAAAAGGATVEVRLVPVAAAAFAAARAAAPPPPAPGAVLPDPAAVALAPKRRQTGAGPLVVVLDPGHGGIDPGAEHEGLREAALILAFAQELRAALEGKGGVRVVLTREDDRFVPLEARTSIARAAGADLLLSLHADALDQGIATGATAYTLAAEASEAAAARLAERHDRADLLAGVDLSGQGDAIAGILMELARAETAPRSERLARHLVTAIGAAGGRLHPRPRQRANFTVLRAPDIPSVLLEVGFMSSPRDLADLTDPARRARLAAGIVAALGAWAVEDAAEAALLRQ
ncbi:MAG: N-acetylmuramoyl-L-alanine amidase [Rhodobacteraceae bacterium]|nr:N-acetylmuramoyl-L-alanine amidase [Paracoccaceae bacterium]